MRVGIVLTDYAAHVGGAFTFQSEIVESLKLVQSEHSFYFFYFGNDNKKSKSEGHTFVEIKRQHSGYDHPPKSFIERVLRKIKRTLLSISFIFNAYEEYKKFKSIQYDIDNPLNCSLNEQKIELVWFVNNFFQPVDIPFVTTVFDLQHRKQPFFPEVSVSGLNWRHREDAYSSCLPRAAYVITGTEVGKKEVQTFYGVPGERIRVLPFSTPRSIVSVDHSQVSEKIRNIVKNKFLFYPAQFWPHKNHIVLLKALKTLIEAHALDISLVFTGSDKGNLSYIEAKVKELKLNQHVHFCGFVTRDELSLLYKSAIALTYPTFFGPDNLPPLEAFSYGCPVIASKVSGAEEQLGDSALLFEPTEATDLVEKILKILNDQPLREKLISSGKIKAQSLNSQDYVQSMVKIMDEFSNYRETWSHQEKYIHT